jgi:inner membrane protein
LDNITHSLVGYTLARAGLGRHTPYAAATLVIASNIPDVDIVSAFRGGSVAYLAAHRGPTHGPLGFLLLAAATAAIVVGWLAWRRRKDATLPRVTVAVAGQICVLAICGTAIHALMDLPTSYGTRLFSPFDWTWYAFDWLPIVDIYLWALLAVGLVARSIAPKGRREIAVGVLVLVLANYAARAGLHEWAIRQGAAFTADGANRPCASAPTLVRHPSVIETALGGPGACIQAAALPTFFSPFRWRIVRQYPNGYEISERNLLASRGTSPSIWLPSEAGHEVARARATRTGRVFLNFSRFPAAHVVQIRPLGTTVRLVDARFAGAVLGFGTDSPAQAPFVVTVEIGPGGDVLREQLGN